MMNIKKPRENGAKINFILNLSEVSFQSAASL